MLLTQAQFQSNVSALSRATGSSPADARYDQEFLTQLNTLASSTGDWSPWEAFTSMAEYVMEGPLDQKSVLQHVTTGHVTPGRDTLDERGVEWSLQIQNRFQGLMAAFSPPPDSAPHPSAGSVQVTPADELIAHTEADYFRCRPFIESITKFLAQVPADGDALIDIVDAGCGPHLFWSVLAASMDPRVRVCAIENDHKLAAQAVAFAQALGVADRIRVIRADATGGDRTLREQICAAFDESAPPFNPTLVVSETHCPMMLSESGDQILRYMKSVFPKATTVPLGVEFLSGVVDAEPIQRALREPSARSRLAPVIPPDALRNFSKHGPFLATDTGIELDALRRRIVRPFVVSVGKGTGTPTFGTRLLFPYGVKSSDSAVEGWLWPVWPSEHSGRFDTFTGKVRTILMSTVPRPLMEQQLNELRLPYFLAGVAGISSSPHLTIGQINETSQFVVDFAMGAVPTGTAGGVFLQARLEGCLPRPAPGDSTSVPKGADTAPARPPFIGPALPPEFVPRPNPAGPQGGAGSGTKPTPKPTPKPPARSLTGPG